MSVQSEIDRINGNVASTYTALSEMGATMPAQQNSDNLPGTVRTVPQGGGTSVQTDWNQMDETAPDFLKNKPFDGGFVSVYSQIDHVPNDELGLGLPTAILLELNELIVGATYKLTFDGNLYEVVAANNPELGICAGDVSMFVGGQSTGEPFLLINMSGFVFLIFFDNEPHTVDVQSFVGEKLPADSVNAEWIAKSLERTEDCLAQTVVELVEGVGSSEVDAECYNAVNSRVSDFLRITENGKTLDTMVNGSGSGAAGKFVMFGTSCYNYTLFSTGRIEVNVIPVSEDAIRNGTLTFDIKLLTKTPYIMPERFMPELSKVVLVSPGGKRYSVTVNDNGALTATEIT